MASGSSLRGQAIPGGRPPASVTFACRGPPNHALLRAGPLVVTCHSAGQIATDKQKRAVPSRDSRCSQTSRRFERRMRLLRLLSPPPSESRLSRGTAQAASEVLTTSSSVIGIGRVASCAAIMQHSTRRKRMPSMSMICSGNILGNSFSRNLFRFPAIVGDARANRQVALESKPGSASGPAAVLDGQGPRRPPKPPLSGRPGRNDSPSVRLASALILRWARCRGDSTEP